MLIRQLPLIFYSKYLRYYLLAVCGGACLILLIGLISLCFCKADKKAALPQKVKKLDEKSYDLMGTGALALNQQFVDFPLPDLKREILLLGCNQRPDAKDELLRLGLRGSSSELVLKMGQVVYLKYGEDLEFSSEKTPFWLCLNLDNENKLYAEVGISLLDAQEKKTRFLLEEVIGKVSEKMAMSQGYQLIQQGTWLEPDLLLEKYGGEEYRSRAGKKRILVDGQIYFVSEDLPLTWKDDSWVQGVASKGLLARLIDRGQGVNIELWDETGLERIDLNLPEQRIERSVIRMQEVMTQIRKRTSKRISCRLDNKSIHLKEGEWVLHQESGWRVLSSLEEIERYLEYQLIGELFIFDGVEKRDGAEFLKGSFFDKYRLQMVDVELPFAKQAKVEPVRRYSSKGDASRELHEREAKRRVEPARYR